MKINFDDISVIVQGPIITKQYLTDICLKSIRKYLPGAEIILSTWKGANVMNLDYDCLIENEDPGASFCDSNNKVLNNVNRQIVSTYSGLLKATKKYSLKFRTDMLLTGNNFIDYFQKYSIRTNEWKILDERVLSCTFYSRNPRSAVRLPFHPSDWFFFGKTTDLLKIWNLPLADEPENSRWFETRLKPEYNFKACLYRYTPEQYIWINFLKQYKNINFEYLSHDTEENIINSEISIANNLVILSPSQLQIKFIKYDILPTDILTTYSYSDWKILYAKYCLDSDRSKIRFLRMYALFSKMIRCLFKFPSNDLSQWIPSFIIILSLILPTNIYIKIRTIFRNFIKKN